MKTPSPSLARRRIASLGALAGLCALLAAPASLHAAVVYNQSFASPVGGLPTDWNINSGFDSSEGDAEIATLSSTNWLKQERDGISSGNSFVYFNGDFGSGVVNDGILSDFSASAFFRISGGSSGDGRGMMVRAGETDATPTGYYVVLSDDRLRIYKDPTNPSSGRGTLLAFSDETVSLAGGTDYRFDISASGSTISAAVYTGPGFSTLVADVSVVDTSYTSGLFGFRSSMGTAGRSVYWKDLTITAVPEPSTVALLGSVAGLCLLRRSRRK